MRAPLAPPRLSEPRNVEADAQAVETSCGHRQAGREDLRLQRGDVLLADQRMIDRRDRVLPDQRLLRHERAEVARDRAHVAVRELEPGAGERVGELVRMLVEAPRDLLVGRVEPQREVGRQHRRHMLLRRVEGVRDRRLPRPSPSTASRRPGSSSAPIRTRTGSRRSGCSTWSASASR